MSMKYYGAIKERQIVYHFETCIFHIMLINKIVQLIDKYKRQITDNNLNKHINLVNVIDGKQTTNINFTSLQFSEILPNILLYIKYRISM